MSLIQKIILYQSLDNVEKKLKTLTKKLGLEEAGVLLVNQYAEETELAEINKKDQELLVYRMGEIDCPWARAKIVGTGPSFDSLSDASARKELMVDFKSPTENPFTRYLMKTKVVKASQMGGSQKATPSVSSEPFPPDVELENLSGHIDNALYAVARLEKQGVYINLPDISLVVGPERRKDMMSYDDLKALLLLFKNIGASNIYYHNKVFFKEEQDDSQG